MGKVDESNLKIIKNYFTDITSYVLEIVGLPINSINKAVNQINSLIFIYSNNKNLSIENKELYKWKDLAQKLLVENEELKKLLNGINNIPNNFITAKVISNSSGSYIKTITINVGTKHGISIGNAVINNWGMVGRIIEVGKKSARVLLVTDINSQIPVYFEKSKHKAIIIGNNSDLLQVKYLKPRVKLVDKERIITSGEGGLLPRGLAVGMYVENLNDEPDKIKVLPTRNWDIMDSLNVIILNKDSVLK